MNFLLLAAGRSQRMGANKALMLFQGKPWIQHQLSEILEAGFKHILVVTNRESAEAIEEITAQYKSVQICINHTPDLGPFSSLQVGLLENANAPLCVSPIDSPVRGSSLRALQSAWEDCKSIDALIPTYQGQKGHPVILSVAMQQTLLSLSPEDPESRLDFALRQLAADKRKLFEINDELIPLNLNSPEDLLALEFR